MASIRPLPRLRRSLGRYSKARPEADLDRFGIFEQARARGYGSTRVEIMPSSGLGPTAAGSQSLLSIRSARAPGTTSPRIGGATCHVLRWTDSHMVLPVSSRLRNRLDDVE